MKFYKCCFLIFTILFLVSCNRKSDKSIKALQPDIEIGNQFFPEYAAGDIKLDTLYLSAIPNDCGEWGGPRDEFKMYVDSVNQYKLEYKRFKFSCDSIAYYRNIKKPILAREKLILIDKKSKVLVSEFFTEILKAKMNQRVPSNAGSWYWLRSRDSTLNIEVYSDRDEIKNKFLRFKKDIGLN
jgi:hypothetical protein